MLLKKQIVSALAGVAILALPIGAFAANYGDNNHARAFAHGQAFRQAAVNYHIAATMASRYASAHNHGQWTPPASWASTPNRPWQPNQSNNGWVPPSNWSFWHHHPYAWNDGYIPLAPVYQPYAAPAYGPPVYPYPAPSYSGYRLPGHSGYGLPGYAGSSLSGYPGDVNNLSSLKQKRHRTMETIARLRAQGDSKGAARLVPTVTALNQRINSMR
jgi:hypothetical protein